MSLSREARVAALLACPQCLQPPRIEVDTAICLSCGRRYPRLHGSWRMKLDDPGIVLPRHLSERFSGRAVLLDSTSLGRLYKLLYVHPVRFVGDLQTADMPNLHRRLASFVSSFEPYATLLDLGSGSRRLGANVVTLDIAALPHVDIVADGHQLPIRTNSLDGVIIQQVLEHVHEPAHVIREAHRVLRQGGRIYCEVPFLYPVHDGYDFRRWTLTGVEILCTPFSKIDVGVSIGPLSAFSAIVRRVATTPARSLLVEAAVDLVLGWLLGPLKYLDELLARWPAVSLVAGAVYFEGRKQ